MSNGYTILIIDDDPGLRHLMTRALEFEGFNVITAKEGQEGLDLFKKHRPNLVVLDIMMPYMDGFEVCQQIRKIADTPILMLTALDDVDNIVRALDLGADDYLTKTFEPDVLVTHVQVLLRRSSDTVI